MSIGSLKLIQSTGRSVTELFQFSMNFHEIKVWKLETCFCFISVSRWALNTEYFSFIFAMIWSAYRTPDYKSTTILFSTNHPISALKKGDKFCQNLGKIRVNLLSEFCSCEHKCTIYFFVLIYIFFQLFFVSKTSNLKRKVLRWI